MGTSGSAGVSRSRLGAWLPDEVEAVLSRLPEKDKGVRVGNRLNVGELLAEEMDPEWPGVGIVVSGPGGFCDDVRAGQPLQLLGRKERLCSSSRSHTYFGKLLLEFSHQLLDFQKGTCPQSVER
ncbi:hypothetical protein QBC46DRAFT_406204 [Diplogelasinospora grovesii]|uniref:Uncharacterized protein n=1 Tax=Diplogelasinospora grovesii TaxID=303347 RepID=A0AAN6NDY9_9PEZI|nr:hypothetical protein QBC46DRAFT_406204 [Diplogelasinospora grovesii]